MELTEKVRRKVVDDILSGKYSLGEKLPAEREMTELTGTSRITVRRAYEQLERAGIITRSKNAGTCVSSEFKGNDDEIGQIAIIATIKDPFSVDFVEAVNRACRENDILNILSLADMKNGEEQAELAASLATKGVKNIIVWGYDKRFDFSLFERLRILGINLVFFDRVLPKGPYADFVGLDNAAAIKSLFERMRLSAKDRMLFIDIEGLSLDSNEERRAEFIALCKKHGIPYEIEFTNYLAKPSPKLAGKLRALRNAAILCVNDSVALSVKELLDDSNALHSIDGTKEAVQAGIPSYSQPMKEMAEAAVECLKRQQRLGSKWVAKQFRFTGGIAVK